MKLYQFTAHIEQDNDTGFYVGYIPNLPGAQTQGETLNELRKNLKEVTELVIEEMTEDGIGILKNEFVGTQEVRIAI